MEMDQWRHIMISPSTFPNTEAHKTELVRIQLGEVIASESVSSKELGQFWTHISMGANYFC